MAEQTNTTTRNPNVAAFLELVCSGLGHLYIGRPKLAILWAAPYLLMLGVLWIVTESVGINVVVMLVTVSQTWIIKAASCGSAYFLAERQGAITLKRYQR